MITQFNIRVYGLCLNEKEEILLSDERAGGKRFTKFPGGGVEFGEGILDALKRELTEELSWSEVEEFHHCYTTDFFQQSAFNSSEQLISIYYWVKVKKEWTLPPEQKTVKEKQEIGFQWKKLTELSSSDVTFPIDQKVADLAYLHCKSLGNVLFHL